MEEEEWFSGFWDLPFLKLGFADESLKIVGFCDLKIFSIWNFIPNQNWISGNDIL